MKLLSAGFCRCSTKVFDLKLTDVHGTLKCRLVLKRDGTVSFLTLLHQLFTKVS